MSMSIHIRPFNPYLSAASIGSHIHYHSSHHHHSTQHAAAQTFLLFLTGTSIRLADRPRHDIHPTNIIHIAHLDLQPQGRAEMTRLCLAIGDIPFENEIITKEEFPQVREKLPYKSLPTLTVDGTTLAQSYAILRYCGKLAGIYPKDELEAFKADEISETVQDLMVCVFRYMGPDAEKLRESRVQFVEKEMPRYLGAIEKRITAWNEGPYVLGNDISIADLALFVLCQYIDRGIWDHVPTDSFHQYARIHSIYNTVAEHPKVVQWYEANPYTKPQ